MNELTEKLMELLSNSESMEKIKNLSNVITEFKKDPEESQKVSADSEEEAAAKEAAPIEAIQAIMQLMPLLSSVNKEDDNTRLLMALRPHLSENRRAKLDKSIKMLQMLKLLPILKSQGIF